jgi:hypothetical protein
MDISIIRGFYPHMLVIAQKKLQLNPSLVVFFPSDQGRPGPVWNKVRDYKSWD